MLHSYENNVKKSILKMPKGYIRDSGLLNHLLRVHHLYDSPQVGPLFESFVIEEHELPLGIVINQGERFEWVTDKIVQIPVGWL